MQARPYHKWIYALRWVAVIPAGLLAWQLSLVLGMLGLGVLEGLCPPEQVVSGACGADWFADAVAGLLLLGASLAAVLILLAAVWVAPSHKPQVAWGVYLSGILVALVMAWLVDAWGEWLAAVVAGGITLVLLRRRLRASG